MSLHGGTRMDRKQAARAIIFERRLLIICLWLAAADLAAWAAAVATEYWYVTECGRDGEPVEETGIAGVPQASLLSGHAGLWKTCKTVIANDTHAPRQAHVITACRKHEVHSISELPADHPINEIIGFWRVSLAFSVLSFVMQLVTILSSWYSIRVPRYTFKRLTGCLYFITAGVQLVVIQVQKTAVELQSTLNPSPIMPGNCIWKYSYSFITAFICLIVNIVCSIGVFSTSGKKKRVHPGTLRHDHPADDDEQAMIMGR